MFLLYNLLLILLLPVLVLVGLHGYWVQGKYKKSFRRRLGLLGRPPTTEREVWLIHAVSVGEAVAAMPFVKKLKKRHPHIHLVFSTVTETGQQQAIEQIEADEFVFFPLDYKVCVEAFLENLKPTRVFILETEIWPNFLHQCHQRGVIVTIVNGRLSPTSLDRYRRIRWFLKQVLAPVEVYAQSWEDAQRFLELGAVRVYAAGNLKLDQLAENLTHPRREVVQQWFHGFEGRCVVLGSFHEKEAHETLQFISSWLRQHPDICLMLAPRHMYWLPAFLKACSEAGVEPSLRSRLDGACRGLVILDTYGELALMYEAACIACIGGSFEPLGGHSPLEPALFGAAVLYGPNVVHFRDICARMEKQQAAIRLRGLPELWERLDWLLEDEAARQRLGSSAQAFIEERKGVSEKILESLKL